MKRSWISFFLLVGCILGSSSDSYAQKENNIWYFGYNAGIDFNSGKPLARTDGQMHQEEGCATMCDRNTGKLLFYTDGISIWNKNHKLMPGGDRTLLGNNHSAQSALILPMPCDSTKYYLFTAPGLEDTRTKGMFYSIIDMTLNGGLGGIVEINTQLLNFATEQMTAVLHQDGESYWIITHGLKNANLYAYRLSADGVDPNPVVSTTGEVHEGIIDNTRHTIGPMIASPDGKHLASAMAMLCELYDFNDATGVVSNGRRLIVSADEYGTCFSPDNTKLYFSVWQAQGYIVQFDITAGNLSAIQATKKRINILDIGFPGGMQLGPDGRIYVAKQGTGFGGDTTLGIIQNPNSAGFACVYVDQGVGLNGKQAIAGLPNIVTSSYTKQPELNACLALPRARFTMSVPGVCETENCITLADHSDNLPSNYLWTFEGGTPSTSTSKDPGTICYKEPGKFKVVLVTSNKKGADSSIHYVIVPASGGVMNTLSNGRLSVIVGSNVDLPLTVKVPNLNQLQIDQIQEMSYNVTFDRSSFDLLGGSLATALSVPPSWTMDADRSYHDASGIHITLKRSGNSLISTPVQLGTLHLTAIAGGFGVNRVYIQSLKLQDTSVAFNYCIGAEGDNVADLVIPTSGVRNSIDKEAFSIYPNPVSGTEISVKAGKAISGRITIGLYDVIGRELFRKDFSSVSSGQEVLIPAQALEPGTYYIRTVMNSEVLTKKITVIR